MVKISKGSRRDLKSIENILSTPGDTRPWTTILSQPMILNKPWTRMPSLQKRLSPNRVAGSQGRLKVNATGRPNKFLMLPLLITEYILPDAIRTDMGLRMAVHDART